MITLFTTAKPFRDHSGIIQRNALKSWTLLHPKVEVILFGDDEGAAEVAREFGLRHEPHVERNEFGTKRLDYMFRRAQEIASNEFLCYSNCDIILFPEICEALRLASAFRSRFLMVGRRWDTDITEPVNFENPDAEHRLRQLAHESGVRRGPDAVDYFVFPRGFYQDLPPLVVGRVWWDHWLVWKAREMGGDVLEVSKIVTAIHQNHGYGYHPAGATGVWTDEQARRNYELAGGSWHLYTIDDATYAYDGAGFRRKWKELIAPYYRYFGPHFNPTWFKLMNFTRPARRFIGLHRNSPKH